MSEITERRLPIRVGWDCYTDGCQWFGYFIDEQRRVQRVAALRVAVDAAKARLRENGGEDWADNHSFTGTINAVSQELYNMLNEGWEPPPETEQLLDPVPALV